MSRRPKIQLLPTIFIVSSLLACTSMAAQDGAPVRGGRIMPPATVSCDRNDLTSWTGLVTVYQHSKDRTQIEIHTDEATVERTVILHPDATDASSSYLLWGETFSKADWQLIEQSTGKLHDGMRATAWICSDGKTPPIIDWQPPQD